MSKRINGRELSALYAYFMAASIGGSRKETQLLLKSKTNCGRSISTILFSGQLIPKREYVMILIN